MNRPNTVLNLRIPNRVRSDLTPEYISKRIPEILGTDHYRGFSVQYYSWHYKNYFSQVGFPIRDVATKETPHANLKVGDVIVIDEIANYSRLYQRVPGDTPGYLILEQTADRQSNPELVIWRTNILPATHLNILNKINNDIAGQYENDGEIIMGLSQLKDNDGHLYKQFLDYLQQTSVKYINQLLDQLPKDKAEVIRNYNPDWDGMIGKLWEDFISLVQDL